MKSGERSVGKLKVKEIEFDSNKINQVKEKIANSEWGIIFQSGDLSNEDCRYEILTSDPICKIVTIDGSTTIETQGAITYAKENPLITIKNVRKSMFGNVSSTPYPFIGGSAGYFSYDLGREFEDFKDISTDDTNMPQMAVGIYNWAVIIDKKIGRVHLVMIEVENAPKLEERLQLVFDCSPLVQPNFNLKSTWYSNMTREEYFKIFHRVREHILDGDIYQVNIAQRFKATYNGNEYTFFKELIEKNNVPFGAYFNTPYGKILSISPERFLKLDNNKLTSKPIKGTRPRRCDQKLDEEQKSLLLTSEKERAENVMIVDLLRNDISKVCKPSTVNVPKLFDIETYPAVHHLVSTISGTLNENLEAEDAFESCFPGGSITGTPKIRAMDIIEKLEPHRRSIYCGSLGYISADGNMDSNISIRTLLCKNNSIYCWAGGGWTIDSNAESEYQETLDKVSKIIY
ncbi:aminodeoxychorismate synthase, component I [Vibrio splendidus]|uniref:aminodeoxychorismate synthase n=1 Tax=Vibrio lentus TaxID=136468 RepID=A0A4V5RC16_9VIBR|nr:aminodeoxychorismate synthase, component I [Vibrio splendidus]TKF37920.1 aminodeoxychorismate synthase component I [Vibrio lentus]TKF52618.1 aminodeoxychorismate synthase component I [Vibrio lentus]TKF95013.1 aminodeoxychorismate synthase component I [Vibrio lentus]TKG00372.1 aminodeoxychorismate synthase component I [Vibrio lentus]